MDLQRFSAAVNAEALSPRPGNVGLVLLRTCALDNVTLGWCQHHGLWGRTRTIANCSDHEPEGDGLPHCL